MHSSIWSTNQKLVREGSCISDIRVHLHSLSGLTPWTFKDISCLRLFNGFDKYNTSVTILKSLFSPHRNKCRNFDIYAWWLKDKQHCLLQYYVGTKPSVWLLSSFSIFSAEFVMIEKALEIVALHNHRNFIICTDSNSFYDAFQSNCNLCHLWPTNYSVTTQLRSQSSTISFESSQQ